MSLRLSGGRRLQSPPGAVARPTPARVRLAVMNLLARRLASAAWLDLCCGSGVMACEALQRGVASVVAVERDRRVAAVARANLELVAAGLANPVPVLVQQREVLAWLGQTPARGFDLIYADPPYRAGLYGPIAAAVAAAGWLRPGGVLLWECASDAIPPLPEGWTLQDQRRYGSTTVLLLEPIPAASEARGAAGAPLQRSTAEGIAAAVLVPGSHEQANEGHRDQTQHDAAEQGFDHGKQPCRRSVHNSSTSGAALATLRHQP